MKGVRRATKSLMAETWTHNSEGPFRVEDTQGQWPEQRPTPHSPFPGRATDSAFCEGTTVQGE